MGLRAIRGAVKWSLVKVVIICGCLIKLTTILWGRNKKMRKNIYAKMSLCLLLTLTGCGQTHEGAEPETQTESDAAVVSELQSSSETDSGMSALDLAGMSDSEMLLDAFLANQIPAVDDEQQAAYMFENFQYDDEEWDTWSVGERVDLDNDGENEQVLNGPYGGWYLDARNQKVYVWATGEGTAGELSYVYYDDAVWIVHRDVTHAGRQMFWLTKYDGNGKIADETQLSAEYWESSDYQYHEDSDFTFGDDKISMDGKELEEINGY